MINIIIFLIQKMSPFLLDLTEIKATCSWEWKSIVFQDFVFMTIRSMKPILHSYIESKIKHKCVFRNFQEWSCI